MPRPPDDLDDATLRLALAPGIGPVTWRRLRESLGSDDAIIDAKPRDLARVDGIGLRNGETIRRALDSADPEAERKRMRDLNAHLLLLDDPDYPALLAQIPDPPAALWVQGDLAPDRDRPTIAIVGSRKCTAYGREQAGRFAAMLAQAGVTIVSGGARGIDAEAHRGARRAAGRTIAVLGSGLARAYPPEHLQLFNRIAREGGAVVSEYPMSTAPRSHHFPRRNRIISGLSLGVLIIEAAERSGALITARQAADEHGRDVMALPGRVDSPHSAGCLAALREGWAALVRTPADVVEQLETSPHLMTGALAARDAGPSAEHLTAASRNGRGNGGSLFDAGLTEHQQRILAALADAGGELHVDALAAQTDQPLNRLMADLTILQMHRRIDKDHHGVRLMKGH